MKNFEEFRRFLLEDCSHEINAIGKKMAFAFTDEDAEKTGLSEESLGKILQITAWQTAQFVMLALERYHEWNETFPE